jgi:hypothetical protein
MTSNAKDEHKEDQCNASQESVTQQQNTQAIPQAMTTMEAAVLAPTALQITIKPTELERIIDSGATTKLKGVRRIEWVHSAKFVENGLLDSPDDVLY